MKNTDNSDDNSLENLWMRMRQEVLTGIKQEPLLSSYYYAIILNHKSLSSALGYHLANKLDCPAMPAILIREIFNEAYDSERSIVERTRQDIVAVRERDPVCQLYSTPFLYFKGFHALQAYRVSHWLWKNNRDALALFIQNRISEVFGVDIHPAAVIGGGIMIDHATGIVIGETAVVEDDVSIMQSVTLGGTGKDMGDRHPKVRKGVLISSGAKILGNVEIGEGAKVGAGSVVLKDVPKRTTVAGVPAKIVGKPSEKEPALAMCHDISSKK